MSPAEDAFVPYDDLIWVCTNLCELLEVENDALERHDAATVRELAENKAALARIYEKSVQPVADDPDLVDLLEPEQKDELRALGGRLGQLVADNARMLKAEMEAMDRLMDAVINAAKATSTSKVKYSHSGTFDIAQHSGTGSLAVNKTF